MSFTKDIWVFSFRFRTVQKDAKIYINGRWSYFVIESREKLTLEEILKILMRKDIYYLIEWRIIESQDGLIEGFHKVWYLVPVRGGSRNSVLSKDPIPGHNQVDEVEDYWDYDSTFENKSIFLQPKHYGIRLRNNFLQDQDKYEEQILHSYLIETFWDMERRYVF
jgi:hypothetical protein